MKIIPVKKCSNQQYIAIDWDSTLFIHRNTEPIRALGRKAWPLVLSRKYIKGI